ncbi:hypothetical protein ACIGAN_06720 [Streptomyces sp. NPDC085931]|uniref:hypothetical protein n=1 Tax=Streptomyces sp. NPDC085931 TaxID=3365740 RepID=UPI0037D0E41E
MTSPHAQVGKEYWVALPTADNVSGQPLTLLRGEIAQVPDGLDIVAYKAFWAARVRVTGKVTGELTGCRYYYRQDDTEYRQNVACISRIRLGPPLD